MRFVSLFAGIGGFDLAFERASMECVAQVEIDKNCLGVLARHWPNVKRYEDVRNVGRDELGAVDLICGGFPCQDLSVAGRREGLAGKRSGLWFEYHRIIADVRPRWVVVENVPGLLSSNSGKDFAVILRGLVECGYGVSWRILDAQYFGLAQRRRRMFIVGSLGNGCSAKVLFESEGVQGDSTPSRETGQKVAYSLAASVRGSGDGHGNAWNSNYVAPPLKAQDPGRRNGGSSPIADEFVVPKTFVVGPLSAHSKEHGHAMTTQQAAEANQFIVTAFDWRAGDDSKFHTGPNGKHPGGGAKEIVRQGDYADALNATRQDAVAYTIQSNDGGDHKRKDRPNGGLYVKETDTALTVGSTDLTAITFREQTDALFAAYGTKWNGNASADNGSLFARNNMGVRRLTPTECERLQGFPDGWTAGQSDSIRYRQLGNAIAVPVAEWIGRRIMVNEVNLDSESK